MGNRGVGAGDQARRAVGSDRNHPVPEPCCSRPGVLVSKGAAHVGAETIGPFGTFAAAMPSLIPQSCGMRCSPCGSSGDGSRALACDARISVSVSVSVSALLRAVLTASENSDPVERLHGARGVCCICNRLDVSGYGRVVRPDDRGDSTRRQAAPAPDQSRSRTGATARPTSACPSLPCSAHANTPRCTVPRPGCDAPAPPASARRCAGPSRSSTVR